MSLDTVHLEIASVIAERWDRGCGQVSSEEHIANMPCYRKTLVVPNHTSLTLHCRPFSAWMVSSWVNSGWVVMNWWGVEGGLLVEALDCGSRGLGF